ncbi:hypothetical protein QMG90_17900 [Trabulsiella odontotermitis]|uniref:hypothetical protein n=1 Tax=Trabulsiella odontotermitis TaxID=379893 RepID=UPI0024B78778|nr:hypothetical protein [Trabulsiella odontotermitis]WHP30620.1 hypothetical protein QMG90_17900 [Trabulsiella odontotermitis]
MKKWILLLSAILLLPPALLFGWFALTSGDHHYRHSDTFSYWLYTPDSLKKVPTVSTHVEYSYSYDADNQQSRFIITWKDITNRAEQKAKLLDFLKAMNRPIKNDCLWLYHDPNNYANNYQRYCVYQKSDTLELELFEISR